MIEELSSSSVMVLHYDDLKKWKTIFCPLVRETRTAIKVRQVKLVTEQTRILIMDFGNIDPQLTWGSQRPFYDLAHAVMLNHPRITRIVACRARVTTRYYVDRPETKFFSFLEVGSFLAKGASVTVLECATTLSSNAYVCFSCEQADDIKAWSLPWPTTVLTDSDLVLETRYQYHKVLLECYPTYWPYPPDQLEWLEVCLGKLPTDDRLCQYLERNTVYARFPYEDYYVKLHGKFYLKSTAAFCARYLTTFRQELDLSPPPHPLIIWKD